MLIDIFTHRPETGWSPPLDTAPALASHPGETLALVFGAPAYLAHPEPLEALARALPGARLAGCSTAGEVLDARLLDEGLVVAVLRLEGTALRVAVHPLEAPEHSYATGATLARELAEHPDLSAVLVLCEGLRVNGSGLVAGMTDNLPAAVTVTGGLAGDGARFERTWVLDGAVPRVGLASAVGFYGQRIRVGHASRGGWGIFGPERRVTRSEGNVLFALDDRPALDIYREYLGDLAAGLPATGLRFPLALRAGPEDPRQLVRTILAIDPDAGSLTFAGDIPEGHLARLMRANADDLIAGAEEAAQSIADGGGLGGPVLSVAVSCVGRRMVLGERTDEELEATLGMFPAGSRQVGFYSYGELSPFADGPCDLHNQTMTLTTIHETRDAG